MEIERVESKCGGFVEVVEDCMDWTPGVGMGDTLGGVKDKRETTETTAGSSDSADDRYGSPGAKGNFRDRVDWRDRRNGAVDDGWGMARL